MNAPDLIEADDRVPVTVLLTPAQAARLEVVIADLRGDDASIDDNDVADALFDIGLTAIESTLKVTA